MSLSNIIENISRKKREDRYFVLNNFQMDYRKLVSLSEEEFITSQTSASDAIDTFESKLTYYATYLVNHGIPFDIIDVHGESGIVINSRKYNEIMGAYMRNAYKLEREGRSLSFLDSKDEWKNDAMDFLGTIGINDTPGIVPIKFAFRPWFNSKHNEVLLKSTYYTGNKDIDDFTFKVLVNFDEFVELLNRKGYSLSYAHNFFSKDRNIRDIHNYQDYYDNVIGNKNNNVDRENERVYVRVRFNENNK